ncbi:MAG TPA: hypothetical protein PKL76_17235 [Phycisphaerae bacterium]|nr:hypothetical protein [Phycisphaerae bacterium]
MDPTLVGLDDDRICLVGRTGAGVSRIKEMAPAVLHRLDNSRTGASIDVHVENAQEDADLDGGCSEFGIVFYAGDIGCSSIGRGDEEFRVSRCASARVTEEQQTNAPEKG